MKKLLGVLLVLVYSCTTTNDGNTTTTTVVPLPPTNLVGTLSPLTAINLSWIDNSTNETGFKIERKTSGGDYTLIGTTDADKTTFADSGLSLGVTYTYRVYAYNAVGKSLTYAYSLDIKTANVPVLTTTLATLTFGGGASSGGNITDNGGSDVTARGVVWSTNTTPTIDLPTKTVDGIGNGVFTSAITGLSAGTTYYVRAYATNGAGTAYGNQISFTETAVPSNGLVGYWPFNGNANDVSGNGNNGNLLPGVTYSNNRFNEQNKSLLIDGVDGGVPNKMITNKGAVLPSPIATNSDFTISTWFQITDLTKGVANSTPSNSFTSQTILCGIPYSTFGLSFNHPYVPNKIMSCIGTGNNWVTCGPNNPISWNFNNKSDWHQMVICKSSNNISYYLDGYVVNSTNINFNLIALTSIQIGGIPVSTGEVFSGRIDDIGIWNRVLTQAEITALYNSTGK